MKEARLVRLVERGRDLPGDRQGLPWLQRSAPAENRGQVGAPEIAHRQPEAAALLAGPVDLGDVRGLDTLRVRRLAQESFADLGVAGELDRQDLHRCAPALAVLLLS